jgi:hypothetical protein
MIRTILGGNSELVNILAIVISVSALAAGVFMLLALFKIDVPITDLILLVFIVMWIIFIIIVDIIYPLSNRRNVDILRYLRDLAAHLMVLGAFLSSTKRFRAYAY